MSQSSQQAFLPSPSHNQWCAETVEHWVDCHGDTLYQYAYSRIGNSSDAEDLVQKAFLAAFLHLQRGNQVESPRTWLVAIVRHSLMSLYRYNKLRQHVHSGLPMSDWFDEDDNWRVRNTFSSLAEHDHSLNESDLLDIIHLCLQRLPANNAIVFQLHVLEEHSLESIRQALNISKTTCATRLHRARLGLSKCVSERWEMEGRIQS